MPLTIEELAAYYRLPTKAFLQAGCREQDGGVAFVFRHGAGNEVGSHIRLRLSKDGTGPPWVWRLPDPGKRVPFGLWRPELKGANWTFLLESEPDAVCLWSLGYPALATGGATSWRPEWWQYLEPFEEVLVWWEDDASLALLRSLLLTQPPEASARVLVVSPLKHGSDLKDPGHLLRDLGPEEAGSFIERVVLNEGRPSVEARLCRTDQLLPALDSFLEAVKVSPDGQRSARCPLRHRHKHDDASPSFSYGEKGFNCFGCGWKGSLAVLGGFFGLVAEVREERSEARANLQTSPPTKNTVVGGEVGGQERLRGVTLAALRRKAKEAGFEAEVLPLLGEREPPVFQRRLSLILASPPKAGKTTLLYAEAREWAQAGATILFISEEPELVWYQRLEAEEADDEVLDRITLLPALGESPDSLLERVSQGQEEIVVLDTAKILGVEDENDAANVNRMITPWVVKARETSKTLIVAHHMRKGGGRAVEALAGSYSWAALFDTVVEIELDEQDSRRRLRAVGRLLPSCKLLYELREGELVLLGSPEEVELEAAKERVLEELTGEWMTTTQVHGALGDPKPSNEQVRRALNSLAAEGKVERNPAWSEGQRSGATYRWRIPATSPTSPPTPVPMVGGEVGGSQQGALPMSPASGGEDGAPA
jgi:hypothetical protein